VTSVFTLLTPLAAKWSFYALIVVRVLEGRGFGATTFSMAFKLRTLGS